MLKQELLKINYNEYLDAFIVMVDTITMNASLLFCAVVRHYCSNHLIQIKKIGVA